MPAPSLNINLKELGSYRPVIDPRRFPTPVVINGTNFIFDVDGPRAGFSDRFYNWYEFDLLTRKSIREFKVESEFFYGTPTGIWQIDPISLSLSQLLPVTTLRPQWPWSFAKVGNRYYFAQHNVGIWQYNPDSEDNEWRRVNLPLNAPCKGVCEAYGRLVALSDELVFWSALDDGTDFEVSISTGAGFLPLSMLSRNAFRVDRVADGFIVSTDKGLLKGESVAASYVFRAYVLSTDVRVFSPNAVCYIDDVGLVALDGNGFHITDGQKPQPWEPEEGEYLKQNYLRQMDRLKLGCLQLFFSHSAKQFFVALAPNLREGTFTMTRCYNLASGKWSVFSRPHHGMFEVKRRPYKLDTAAFMDVFGFIHRLGPEKKNIEVFPNDGSSLQDYVFRSFEEPAVRVEIDEDGDEVVVGITDIHLLVDPYTPAMSGLFEVVEREYSDTTDLPDNDIDPDWEEF